MQQFTIQLGVGVYMNACLRETYGLESLDQGCQKIAFK